MTCNTAVCGYNGSGTGDLTSYELSPCGSFSAQWEESIYRLIALSDGTLQAALDMASEYGHSMYVLEGDCSPDSCIEGAGNWFSIPMTAGQTYCLVVEQDAANAPSTFDFDITCSP